MNDRDRRLLVPTVERTFRILQALASEPKGQGVSELSRRLGLAKSTTFNILTTLEQLGYVYRLNGDGSYHLGLKLFSLSSEVVERIDLRRITAPLLEELVEVTGETANLGTIQGDEAIYIESLPGPGPVKVAAWPGKRLSLHSTALGKALVAFMPEEQVETILTRKGLTAHTANTHISLEALKEELGRVRAQGYALDDEEDMLGMRCIGAPIFDHRGRVVAAVSLTAPAQRMPRSEIPRVARTVLDYARRMCQRLGYQPDGWLGSSP